MSNKLESVLGAKPIKRLKNQLTSGNLWLYLLSLIKAQKKLYAYNVDEMIEKEFFFRPSKVMIYVVLYKLEDEKLIKSEFEKRRKYYSLTKIGAQTLENAKQYFKILSDKL